MSEDIHPAQLRAARALVGWKREDLAAAAGTTSRTLARLEAGETAARASTARAIRAALEAAGVEFIAENGGGPGVRLRERSAPHFELGEKANGMLTVAVVIGNERRGPYDFFSPAERDEWIAKHQAEKTFSQRPLVVSHRGG